MELLENIEKMRWIKPKINKWDVYGNLTIISEAQPYISPNWKRHTKVLVKCLCWKVKWIRMYNLIKNLTRSCWCLNKYQKRKDWLYNTPFYRVYHNMMQRCYNTNHSHFKYYWALWVTVSDKWRESFDNFRDDMYESYLEHKKNNTSTCLDKDIYCHKNHISPTHYSSKTCSWVTSDINMNHMNLVRNKWLSKEKNQTKKIVASILNRKKSWILFKWRYYKSVELAKLFWISHQYISVLRRQGMNFDLVWKKYWL